MGEYRQSDIAELMYRAVKVDCNHGNEVETIILLGTSINEKAEWIADITQVMSKGKRGRTRAREAAKDRHDNCEFSSYCSVWRMKSRTRFFSLKGEHLTFCLGTETQCWDQC